MAVLGAGDKIPRHLVDDPDNFHPFDVADRHRMDYCIGAHDTAGYLDKDHAVSTPFLSLHTPSARDRQKSEKVKRVLRKLKTAIN